MPTIHIKCRQEQLINPPHHKHPNVGCVGSKKENMKQPFEFDTTDPLALAFTTKDCAIDIYGGLPDRYNELEITVRLVNKESQERSLRDRVNFFADEELQLFKSNAIERLFFEEDILDKNIELFIQCVTNYRVQLRKQKIQEAQIMVQDERGTMNQKEIQTAQKYLESKKLFQNLQKDLANIGVVGESENLMLLFLIMTSRLLDNPLNALLISKSGSGKSELMERVAKLMPATDTLEITGISNKALFHFGNQLSHRVLLLQDMTGIDREITQQLQELISKKQLTRLVSEKTKHGNYVSNMKRVKGPICLIGASTEDVYEDLTNRSIQLFLDESPEQDTRIMERQRQQVAGLVDFKKEESTVQKLLHVQSLLKGYQVVNPYATELQLPDSVLGKRRSNIQFLSLINVVTLLFQFQRKKENRNGQEVLITDLEDIKIANTLVKTLLTNKADLLANGERKFYEQLKDLFKGKTKTAFSTSEASRKLRTPLSSVKRHLRNLKEKGYIQIIGGDRYKEGYQYSLDEDGDFKAIQIQIENLLNGTYTQLKTLAQ